MQITIQEGNTLNYAWIDALVYFGAIFYFIDDERKYRKPRNEYCHIITI